MVRWINYIRRRCRATVSARQYGKWEEYKRKEYSYCVCAHAAAAAQLLLQQEQHRWRDGVHFERCAHAGAGATHGPKDETYCVCTCVCAHDLRAKCTNRYDDDQPAFPAGQWLWRQPNRYLYLIIAHIHPYTGHLKLKTYAKALAKHPDTYLKCKIRKIQKQIVFLQKHNQKHIVSRYVNIIRTDPTMCGVRGRDESTGPSQSETILMIFYLFFCYSKLRSSYSWNILNKKKNK